MRSLVLCVILAGVAGVAAHWLDFRSALSATHVELGEGIHYERVEFEGARAHLVRLGLSSHEPHLTRPLSGLLPARTVLDHARRSNARVAINASFFHPFHSNHPWDFAPRFGEITTPVGGLLVDGEWSSEPDPNWPMLCFAERAFITARCPAGTRWGVAGAPQLVHDGVVTSVASPAEPRTAVGVLPGGRDLLLAVVDGRQPHSKGLSWNALARLLEARGVRDALNLDGGGSSTLVIHDHVLNSPIHTRVPGRQRPVPVHLGFRPR